MMHHYTGPLKVWGLLVLNFITDGFFHHSTLQTVLVTLSIVYTCLRIRNELRNTKK